MHIARMEAVRDLAGSLVQNSRRPTHRPVASERPLVERQSRGCTIGAAFVDPGGVLRREVLAAVVSDIGFWRSQAAPVGGRLETAALDRDEAIAHLRRISLLQQSLNGSLGGVVGAFSELMVANAPAW